MIANVIGWVFMGLSIILFLGGMREAAKATIFQSAAAKMLRIKAGKLTRHLAVKNLEWLLGKEAVRLIRDGDEIDVRLDRDSRLRYLPMIFSVNSAVYFAASTFFVSWGVFLINYK